MLHVIRRCAHISDSFFNLMHVCYIFCRASTYFLENKLRVNRTRLIRKLAQNYQIVSPVGGFMMHNVNAVYVHRDALRVALPAVSLSFDDVIYRLTRYR